MKKFTSALNLGLFLLSFLSFSQLHATTHNVTVMNFGFSPSALNITQGDTVIWTLMSGSHNVNGTQATFPSNPASFGGFPASSSWPPFEFVFAIPGSYNYQCDPHSGAMQGTITVAPAAASGGCDLFISEYIEGSSNNKAIELYNPTSSTINLSDYEMKRANNGSTSYGSTLGMSGSLGPYETYLIANPSADSALLGIADTTDGITFFNGNDVLHLFHIPSGDLIDGIGRLGEDSIWTVPGVNGVSGSTGEHTLVRAGFVTGGDSSWSVVRHEWYVFPQNEFGYFGHHNGAACGSSIPAYMISEVKGFDANGVADSNGVECQLTGVIHNPDQGFFDVEFAFQDGSAGIWLEGNPSPDYSPIAEGDLIRVWGRINFSSGVTEFDPDSMVLISAGNPLFVPEKMDTINEYTEGRYIRIDSARMLNVNPGDTFAIGGGGVNYTFVTIQTDTFQIRVDRAYEDDWNGNPLPTGLFNMVGIGSQFDGSSPHFDNYQIFPSRYSDFEILSVAGEAISFAGSSGSVPENGGSHLVLVTVADTLNSPSTVEVNHTGGTAVSGVDFTFNDTTLNFSAGEMDSFWLEVTIIDNAVANPDKTVILSLENLTGSAVYGIDTVYTLTITNDDIPAYSIATIRGNDTDGIADSIGVYCSATGVVLGVDVQGTSANNAFSFDDGTGGISLFKFGGFTPPYTVTEGDSVRVIGVVSQFNGLSQFNPDSMVVISSGANVPAPFVVTDLDESTESRYIRINDVTLVDPSQWNTGNSFTAQITNGTDTFDLRADSDISVSDMLPPVGVFDVIGIGGQFDLNGPPYTTGYQILPMDSTQIIPVINPGPSIPTYSIGDVIGVDSDFLPDSLGVECKLVGVVYGENFRPSGIELTLIDPLNNDDGIQIFSGGNPFGVSLQEGDEIRVIGEIGFLDGMTRILPDSIVEISSGNTLKNPTPVSIFDEFSESNLVEREGTYVGGSWSPGGTFDVTFDELAPLTGSFTVTIHAECDLNSAGAEPIDGEDYRIIGIGGQRDLSSPWNSGYRLLPRRSSDLTLISGFEDALNSSSFNIYPVPSSGIMNIDISEDGFEEVQVMDMIGNVMFTREISKGHNVLNLGSLPSGNYLIKASGDTRVETRKITIVK